MGVAREVHELCRLCLRGDGEISVFDIMTDATTISKNIYDCVSIDICRGDQLPSSICQDCLEHISSWTTFMQICDSSQRTLHLWLTDGTVNETLKEAQSTKPLPKQSPKEKPAAPPKECNKCGELLKRFANRKESDGLIEISDSEDNEQSHPELPKIADKGIKSIIIESTESLPIELFNEHVPADNSQDQGKGGLGKETAVEPSVPKVSNGPPPPEKTPEISDEVMQDAPELQSNDNSKLLTLLTSKDKKSTENSELNLPTDSEKNKLSENNSLDRNAPGENENSAEENLQIMQSFSIDKVPDKPVGSSSPPPVSVNSSPPLEAPEIQSVIVKSEPISDIEEDAEIFSMVNVKQEPVSEEEQDEEGFKDQHQDPVASSEAVPCLTCNRKFANRSYYLRHLKSKIHKRLCAIKNRNTQTRKFKSANVHFDSDSPWVHTPTRSSVPDIAITLTTFPRTERGAFKFHCKPCSLYFKSRSEKERHCQSLRHQTEIAKHNSLMEKETFAENEYPSGSIVGENIFACPVENCDLTFSSGLLLISHMKRHGIVSNMSKELISTNFVSRPQNSPAPQESKISRECHKCQMKFSSAVGLSNHLRFCNRRSSTSARPLRKEIKDGTGIKFCPFCQVKFTEEASFLSHIEINHKGSSLYRSLCIDKKAQIKKQNIIMSTKGGIYKCKLCPKSYNFARSLNLHMKNHLVGNEETIYACKVCKKTFGKFKNYRLHLRAHFVPTGSGHFFCVSCYQTFKTRRDIARHKALGKCSPIKIKIYSCNICNHSYNKLSSLEEHKARFHGGSPIPDGDNDYLTESIFPETYCKECDKTYSCKANLMRHFRTAHEGWPKKEELFMDETKFNIDEKISLEEDDLVEDKKPILDDLSSHSSNSVIEEKYPCKYCNREYSQKRYVKHHMIRSCPVLVHKYKKCGSCSKFVSPRLLTKNGCKYCVKYKNNIRSNTNTNIPTPTPPTTATGILPGNIIRTTEETDIKDAVYQCPIGNKQFMSRTSMLNHYASCNGRCISTAVFCKVCRQRYPDMPTYRDHKFTCGNPPISQLEQPQTETETEAQTQPQTQERVEETEITETDKEAEGGELSCTYCNRAFTKIKNKEEHELKCASCSCATCGVNFRSLSLLRNHQKKYKNKCDEFGAFSRTYTCLYCTRARLYQPQLYKHAYNCVKRMLREFGKFSCSLCHTEFNSTDTVKETTTKVQACILECHKVPYHPTEKPLPDSERVLCYLCCFAFVNYDSFRTHMTDEHGAKPRLSVSSQSVQDSVSDNTDSITMDAPETPVEEEKVLIEKRKPITGTRKFQCTYCSRSFLHHKHLIFHKSTHHSNPKQRQLRNKNLRCKICNRQFLTRPKLRNHEKVHGIIRKNVYADDDESNQATENNQQQQQEQLQQDVPSIKEEEIVENIIEVIENTETVEL